MRDRRPLSIGASAKGDAWHPRDSHTFRAGKDARVVQVGVRQGYSGSVRYCIGIGSTIGEVGQLLGPVHEDFEDNLVVLGVPGLCFETSIWRGERLEENRDAPITGIFVFREAGERPVAVAEEVRDD